MQGEPIERLRTPGGESGDGMGIGIETDSFWPYLFYEDLESGLAY
jgi:hypothetical protein